MNYTELHKTTPATKNFNNYIKTTRVFYHVINYQSINIM